jgi:hypothetical protein
MVRRCFMFWIALLACAPLLSSAADELRISKPEVRKDVLAVVDAQLAAFRASDPAKAYGLASSALRAQTPQRTFNSILQTNYPEIWANAGAEYGLVRDDGTRARVLVRVLSEKGDASFDYVLVKERNAWRIGSVLRSTVRKKDDV